MAPRRFLPDRFRWPLALLLASVGLTAAAAFDAQRAVRSNRRIADQALQEYASFAAWSYQQHLHEALSSDVAEALGAVNHGDDVHHDPRVPDATSLPHFLRWDEACGCHRARRGPNPVAYYGFRLGTDTLAVAVNRFVDPSRGWLVDEMHMSADMTPMFHYAPESALRRTLPDERRWIVDTITRAARARGEGDAAPFPILVAERGGVRRVLAWTRMPTVWGDTLVYAAEYGAVDFRALLGRVLDEGGLLPAPFTRGRTNRDVLAVEVRDAAGQALFTNDSTRAPWRLDATYVMPPGSGGLTVHARIRPALADQLIIGGLPHSRLPYLLGLLALATALSLVAVVQLRREGELARLRAEFVSSVSHELRTPLAQVRLYLDTLRLGRFTSAEQRTRSLDIVDRETRRLAHLVENVLRFSGSGRADGAPRRRVELACETATIVEEFAPLAATRRARVIVDVGAPVDAALRSGALRQVLLNLLDNAVKYGPVDQTIRVVLARTLRDGAPRARLTIEDEGPGIPAAERDAVWRPFQRGASAAESGIGGSGIGLAVVREIVESHDGRVAIEAAPSGGARVVVELPALEEEALGPRPSALGNREPLEAFGSRSSVHGTGQPVPTSADRLPTTSGGFTSSEDRGPRAMGRPS